MARSISRGWDRSSEYGHVSEGKKNRGIRVSARGWPTVGRGRLPYGFIRGTWFLITSNRAFAMDLAFRGPNRTESVQYTYYNRDCSENGHMYQVWCHYLIYWDCCNIIIKIYFIEIIFDTMRLAICNLVISQSPWWTLSLLAELASRRFHHIGHS